MTLDLLTTAERPPKCPLFVELCAGTAAVSLALQGDCRPPVSRMGAKTGYAEAILAAVGLKPRDGAACYLWCEPDDGARAMLMSYALPDLRAEAAEIIRGWKDEDPRALWERLRAEGPIRGVDGREVARWALCSTWSHGRLDRPQQWTGYKGPGSPMFVTGRDFRDIEGRFSSLPPQPLTLTAPDARPIDPYTLARWLRIVTANRLINVDSETLTNTGKGGTTHGGAEFCTPPERLADATEQVVAAWPGVAVVADGRVVDPREVARWICLQECQYGGLGVANVNGELKAIPKDGRPRVLSWGGQWSNPQKGIQLLDIPPQPPTLITDDARPLHPPELPPGSVVLFDPPYQDTTGYAHDLPREDKIRRVLMAPEVSDDEARKVFADAFKGTGWTLKPWMTDTGQVIGVEGVKPGVLTIAKRWADAGATVIICEAVPLGSVVHEGTAPAEPGPLEGWHCYEITGLRKGQKRTFSKQQREWLTMSKPADKAWAAGLALTNRALRRQANEDSPRETLGLFG